MFTFELQSHLARIPISISCHGTLKYDERLVAEALEYDRSMMEFGEVESALLEFFYYWDKEPIGLLHFHTIFSGSRKIETESSTAPNSVSPTSGLLMLDYVKHVISGKHKNWILRKLKIIEDCIVAEKHFSEDASDMARSNKWNTLYGASGLVEKNVDKKLDLIYKKEGSLSCNSAMFTAASWASNAFQSADSDWAQHVSDHAATVVGCRADRYRLSDEFKEAFASEQRWQIRRLANVLEEINVGRPWPPLRATE